MKKVLLVAYDDLNNSGVPNVIYNSIKALCDEYTFDVLVFGDDDYYYRKLVNEGININLIRFNEYKPNGKISKLLWWFWKRPRNHYLFTKNLINKNKYLIVHSFKEYDSWPFLKAAKKCGVEKRIFHCNVNLTIDPLAKNKALIFKNRRLSLKYANLFIGVSELSCKSAFGDKPYTVLHNCYDEQKYNMNVKNKLSIDELVLTQVGYYSENKNQLFSLQVLKELLKLHKNSKLNLVGANGITPYYQKLIDYVKDNNLENNVSFIEKSDSVEKIYEKTTFVIIPSIREGFSLVAVEAQACGMKNFTSDTISSEVDCCGINFFNLKKGPLFLANKIYKIFREEGNNRINYNVEKFSFGLFLNKLKEIYNEDLRKKR